MDGTAGVGTSSRGVEDGGTAGGDVCALGISSTVCVEVQNVIPIQILSKLSLIFRMVMIS